MNVIEKLNKAEEARLLEGGKTIPDFSPGDTLVVQVRITEGTRTRLQAFEGVCIARSGKGVNESFTVRKISYGEGVERVFPVFSPLVEEIEVKRKGKVRRAKLYYLRGRRGRSARIAERTDVRARRLNAAWKGFKKQKGQPDDLSQINGIDEQLLSRLKQLNCVKLEQVANFSDDDITNIDDFLKLDGQIEKQDWVGQAQNLIAESAAAEAAATAEAEEAAAKAAAEQEQKKDGE